MESGEIPEQCALLYLVTMSQYVNPTVKRRVKAGRRFEARSQNTSRWPNVTPCFHAQPSAADGNEDPCEHTTE